MENAVLNQLVLQIAEKLREHATRQDVIPFLTGDLKKSVIDFGVQSAGPGRVMIGSNLSYARAVHDGRPALTIKPKHGKFLFWKTRKIGGRTFPGAKHPVREVHQKARKAKPFFLWAARNLQREGYGFLYPFLVKHFDEEIAKNITKEIRVSFKV
jgi:hypothetical protein